MKKSLFIIVIFLSICFTIVTYADVDFDPSIYTNEELEEIISTINNYLPQSSDKSSEAEVLYDEDGVYVEFRGIYKYSSSSYIVDLYVDNTKGEEIYLSLRDGRVNRASIGFSNNGISIQDNSIYLASANFDFIIDTDDLRPYGIDTINQLDFTLNLKTGGMFGDTFLELPVSLALDVPIEE